MTEPQRIDWVQMCERTGLTANRLSEICKAQGAAIDAKTLRKLYKGKKRQPPHDVGETILRLISERQAEIAD